MAAGSRRRLVALARSGYVETTSRPSASTPPVTGESCGRPSARVVTQDEAVPGADEVEQLVALDPVFVAIGGMPPA